MPFWVLVVLAVLGWLVLAGLLGVGLGTMIKRRDQQVQRPDRPPEDR